ncbi:MAG: glycosyl hydrolase family 18 protein [Bacillota bacterium]
MAKLSAYCLPDNKASRISFLKNHDQLDRIIPVCLQIKSRGEIINSCKKEDSLLYLRKNMDPKVISPLVQNCNLDSEVSNIILDKPTIWGKIIRNLINYMQDQRFSSLNLNLEGIKPDRKTDLNQFVYLIRKSFQKINFNLELSLPAKIEDNCSEWGGAYDYQTLSQLCDRFMVMAYDYHWTNGPSGAIAPLWWVKDVIDYVLINCLPEKVFLGIPCYGYDWVINQSQKPARGLSHQQVRKIITRHSLAVQWSQKDQVPFIKYQKDKKKHEVWFENKESIIKKLQLVNAYNLGGAVFWRLGLEDPELWNDL